MPNWSLEGNTGILREKASAAGPHMPDLKPAGPVFDKYGGADIGERIAQAAQAKKREKPDKPTLQVDAVGAPPTSLRSTDATQVALGTSDRIDQARRLIRESQYAEALSILDEVLVSSPDHAQARYLKGYCQFSLDEPEKALRTIAPLIKARPSPLDSMLRQLRLGIREKMVPSVIEWIGMSSMRGDNAAGIRRVDDLLALDPDVGIYHCVRVHLLMGEDRLDEAAAYVRRATEHCHGADKDILDAMHKEILRRQFELAVEPARQHYRNRNYRKTRKALEQIRGAWGTDPLWTAFYGYLQALGGGFLSKGRMPSEVVPQGPFAVIDRLHFLLVREEIGFGKRLLLGDDFLRAGMLFDRGLQLAPHFPYLNYLQAQTMYATLVMEADGDEPIDIEEHQGTVALALRYANIGAKDKEIDGAEELRDGLAELERMLASIRAEIEKQQREIATVLGPLDAEFRSIMESAQNGITSVELFRTLQQRLRALRQSVASARKKVSSDMARESLLQMEKAVERNWSQLSEIEPEVETAEQIMAFRKRLEKTLTNAPKGAAGMRTLRASLETLEREVETFKKKKSLTGEGRDAADGIINDIRGLMRQLDGMRNDVADAEKVNPLMERFNRATKDLKNIRGWSSWQVEELRTEMASIVIDGGRIKGELTGQQAKKTIGELVDAASGILTALSR